MSPTSSRSRSQLCTNCDALTDVCSASRSPHVLRSDTCMCVPHNKRGEIQIYITSPHTITHGKQTFVASRSREKRSINLSVSVSKICSLSCASFSCADSSGGGGGAFDAVRDDGRCMLSQVESKLFLFLFPLFFVSRIANQAFLYFYLSLLHSAFDSQCVCVYVDYEPGRPIQPN